MQQHQRLGLVFGILGACLAWCSTPAVAQEYLKEPPSFLKPCRIHGPQDDKCMAEAFENLFSHWRNGIPGLKTLGAIDPFHVKKLRLQQRTENLADLRVELKDLVATGLSSNKVLKTTLNDKDYTLRFHLLLPSLKIESDYKLKGRVLVLNIDSHGKMQSKINDLDYIITAKTNLKKVGDEYFFDVQSISSNINKIGNFQVHFTNLFNGNKELEDSAHQLFDQSWREIFEVMRPGIAQTLDAVTLNRYKAILNYIPARFFASDLP